MVWIPFWSLLIWYLWYLISITIGSGKASTSDPTIRALEESLTLGGGVRPTLHYSVSREDILIDHDPDVLPDRDALIASGFNKQKLRAHSDRYWNRSSNKWAAEFLESFDIQLESKHKNLAADDFVSSLGQGHKLQ